MPSIPPRSLAFATLQRCQRPFGGPAPAIRSSPLVADNGADTATWQVTDLAAGQYTVQVAWPGYFANASNAPFAIYDSSTLLQTVPVDQTQQPVGTVYGGVPFQTIATVAITSGTLKVVLSDSGANNVWIEANAVRVAPAAASTLSQLKLVLPDQPPREGDWESGVCDLPRSPPRPPSGAGSRWLACISRTYLTPETVPIVG